MMRLTKKAVGLSAALTLVLTSACSSTTGTNPKDTPNTPTSTEAAKADTAAKSGDSGKKVEIRYSFWGIPEEVKVQEQLKKKFEEEHPNITVKLDLISSTDQFFAALLTQIAGGKAPDVFYIGEALVSSMAEKGVLMDLMPYAKQDNLNFNNYYSADLDPMGYKENHLWAFPKDTTPYMMYYNKDLFDKAGVPYPTKDWTWTDFLTKAQALTVKDDKGKVKQYGYAADLAWPPIISTIYKNNGSIMDESGKKFVLEQPEALEALNWTKDLMYKYQVSPSPSGLKSLGVGNQDLFNSQKAAMISGGRWIAFFSQPLKAKWGVVPFPKNKPDAKSPLLFVTLAAPKTTEHPKEAWEFIRFCISESGQKIISSTGLGMPVLKPVVESDNWLLPNEPKEHIDIYKSELETARSLPFHPQWAKTIDDFAMKELDNAFRDTVKMEDAVKKIDEGANKILAGQ